MSGIAGIIHLDGAPADPALLHQMTDAMAYRGPDGIHHWCRGSVALGQCMLRTTPESLEEQQPLANEDESLVLVMDGRVDNWEELRRELLSHGAVLRSRADAELVLRAYETWGRDCLQHIDGDFALVIWDARRQEAFCARDRVGNKPFNYHWNGKTLVFASELHTILALPWVPEELNEGMVAEFLANEWYSRDETFWKGVLRLVAAHQMVVSTEGPRSEQYWAPNLQATLPCTTDEEYAEYYRELLTDIVRRMSRSSQPVACEVSGGLDSSAIFAVAEHLRQQRLLLAPGIEGYTLAFNDDSDANELKYARAVGQHLDRTIHEIAPSRMPLSWYRDWAQRYREFPSFPNGVMGLGLQRAARHRGSRVLLCGTGGDEWLTGSRSYYADAVAAGDWSALFQWMAVDRREVGLTAILWHPLRYGLFPLLPDNVRQLIRCALAGNRSSGMDKPGWLKPDLARCLRERRAANTSPVLPNPVRVRQRDLGVSLYGAYAALARELEERMASSGNLELRQPYFDARMVQFAFATPAHLMLRGRTDKFLHRRALRGLLPAVVLTRTQKAEFSSTFRWYVQDLKGILEKDALDRHVSWVYPESAIRLLDRFEHDRHSGTAQWLVWALIGCTMLV